MRRFFLLCCIVLGGVILTPCTSFSVMHISNAIRFDCWGCHPEGVGSGLPITPCTDCHKNSSGGGYTDVDTIEVATHSSEVIGSDKYAPWGRECLDCHDNHVHNGITKADGILDNSYVIADLTVNDAVNTDPLTQTTFNTMAIGNIYDSDWSNPLTWSEKTGPERGLILVLQLGDVFYWFEIVNVTETSITIGNNSTAFTWRDNPISGQIIYGMLIRGEDEPINGTAVKFSGPKTMAHNDELGAEGNDSTPDGICQVCHTQTTHWRNDGSEANHFGGWNCSMCHPHEQGFKPVIPLMCP